MVIYEIIELMKLNLYFKNNDPGRGEVEARKVHAERKDQLRAFGSLSKKCVVSSLLHHQCLEQFLLISDYNSVLNAD
jgi:hypothetical protein